MNEKEEAETESCVWICAGLDWKMIRLVRSPGMYIWIQMTAVTRSNRQKRCCVNERIASRIFFVDFLFVLYKRQHTVCIAYDMKCFLDIGNVIVATSFFPTSSSTYSPSPSSWPLTLFFFSYVECKRCCQQLMVHIASALLFSSETYILNCMQCSERDRDTKPAVKVPITIRMANKYNRQYSPFSCINEWKLSETMTNISVHIDLPKTHRHL